MIALTRSALAELLRHLDGEGYDLLGPTLRDGAIVLDRLDGIDDLPAGRTHRGEPGGYRTERRDDDALFGHTVGPDSWKRWLYPPERTLWTAERSGATPFTVRDGGSDVPAYALVGVRSCDLRALAILDRVLLEGTYADPDYRARRERAFVVAVHCTEPIETCFCASVGAGPRVANGHDIVLTEVVERDRHLFLAESGSERGRRALEAVSRTPADADLVSAANRRIDDAGSRMVRSLDTDGLRDLLYRNVEHLRWDRTGDRCLACGNCTAVCPTCFCHTVEDVTGLAGSTTARVRRWDSCFTARFSYIHGGSIRASRGARYRHWMTHKLASWNDQFGDCGCVGCGRCISWCPVGIDITEEARAIRKSDRSPPGAEAGGPASVESGR